MSNVPPRRSSVPAVCEYCGIEFLPMRGSRGRFCSIPCAAKHRSDQWLTSPKCLQPGDRHGEWTVLGYSHGEWDGKGVVRFFRCRCSCGIEQLLRYPSLRSKGCLRCKACVYRDPMPRQAVNPGDRYGSWTILRYSHHDSHPRAFYLCRCECGTEKAVSIEVLRGGGSQQCKACFHKSRTTHGHARDCTATPEYKTWQGMRQRCSNPHNAAWALYGGRGIRVCERWEVFENFLADMGPRPSAKHSLDRVNGDLGYSPDNCRWATTTEQGNNRRNCLFIEWDGRIQTARQWDREKGLPPNRISQRLAKGWSIEQAITEPLHPTEPGRPKKIRRD